jgi:hypothetical protein
MPRNASLALLALLAMLAAAAAASVARADYPSIYVTFLPTSTLRVMLADGTFLGTSSGAPTVIPPGSYNLLLDDSSLVSDVTFDLAGPNVKLVTNMSYGEETAETWVETFLPNSTYTWRDDMKPATVFTFVTSSTPSAGAAPQTGIAPGKSVSTTPIASSKNGKAEGRPLYAESHGPVGEERLQRAAEPQERDERHRDRVRRHAVGDDHAQAGPVVLLPDIRR